MARGRFYLMENLEETIRLEIKTDVEAVRKQALWCGLKPGLRVLDAGCGPGKTTLMLYEMVQPSGKVLGVDYSEERIGHAERHYGQKSGIDFQVHDLRDPLNGVGLFDVIWVRFVLEYNRVESPEIIKNLTQCLKPGGCLCLLELDHNCLNQYELPANLQELLHRLMEKLEREYNFDPFSGRKLYAYLYDLGYQNIQMELMAHHLIYGKVGEAQVYNWSKKVEVISAKTKEFLEDYPGGQNAFYEQFTRFFLDPRRFTYTPLILCKGVKQLSPSATE